jgi:hypothetical protein
MLQSIEPDDPAVALPQFNIVAVDELLGVFDRSARRCNADRPAS